MHVLQVAVAAFFVGTAAVYAAPGGTQAVSASGVCAAAPAPDTLNGSPGTGQPCTPRADATRPSPVQKANTITDASGNWSWTFPRAFNSPAPVVNPIPLNTGTLPIACNVTTRSATQATGRCWQANTATLPGTVTALFGLVLNMFSNAAAGVPVMIVAGEPTQ